MWLTAVPTPQNEYLKVTCQPTDLVGDVVYVTGNNAVTRTVMTNTTKGPGIGIIFRKPTNTTAIIQTRGYVRGVYTGLSSPGYLFVSDAGRLVTTVPAYPSSGSRYAQRFAQIINADTFLILHESPVILNA